jgi:hypothetical protein
MRNEIRLKTLFPPEMMEIQPHQQTNEPCDNKVREKLTEKQQRCSNEIQSGLIKKREQVHDEIT